MDDTSNRVGLYRADFFDNYHVSQLEKATADGYCVAFNSVQSAIQACMELLGDRTMEIPVVLPITAGPDEISGVLRGGATPLLMDIDEEYLQIDPEPLGEALKIMEEDELVPIVLLDKPVGDEINPKVLELIQNVPSICVYRGEPYQEMEKDYFPCAFNIFDLTPVVGSGALLFHSYQEQIKHLKLIRSGVMGLAANMEEGKASAALIMFSRPEKTIQDYEKIKAKYEESDLELMPTTKWPNLIWVKVKDAKLTATHLKSYGIDVQVALYPLHDLSEIRNRFRQEPDYPVADKLKNQLICVPTHYLALERTDEIIKLIGEINE